MNIKTFFILITFFIFTGCSIKQGNYAFITTKHIDMNATYSKIKENYTGHDHEFVIVIFPSGKFRIEDAVNNILKETNADYMTNVSATQDYWFIPFIYYDHDITVTGDVWKKNSSQTNGELQLEK